MTYLFAEYVEFWFLSCIQNTWLISSHIITLERWTDNCPKIEEARWVLKKSRIGTMLMIWKIYWCIEKAPIHITLLALICPALGSQIDFENMFLRAGQNEAGQTKGRSKLGHLKLFAQNNWTRSIVSMQLNLNTRIDNYMWKFRIIRYRIIFNNYFEISQYEIH